jgi:hypothetical protein
VAEETDKLSLTNGQKTRLLGLALEPDKPAFAADADEERGDLLWDILRQPLPMDRPSREALSAGSNGPYQRLQTMLGPPLGEVLQNPKTDIIIFRQIKDLAKRLGEQAAPKAEKDVFLVVYFAAIAGALAFHNERITRHSNQDLIRFFGLYGEAGWVSTEIKGLFRKTIQKLSKDKREC